MNSFDLSFKTISIPHWKKQEEINEQNLDGWQLVRVSKMTQNKTYLVFKKILPIERK